MDLATQMSRVVLLILLIVGSGWSAEPIQIEPNLIHLRNGKDREWSDFPETSPGSKFEIAFNARKNNSELSMFLRQQDVKQQWNVTLNEKRLGELVKDENDMTIAFAVAPELLKDGPNHLVIEAGKSPIDDIRVGEIRLDPRPLAEALGESTLEVSVTDRATGKLTPCRLTILDSKGSMVSFGTPSSNELAIRPGTVYSATGNATVKLPAGKYRIYAGRGFEYSLDQSEFEVQAGQTHRQALSIQREVPTPGYVACDPHIHTLTHSGHGDSTIEERMITLAGEAIELAIATDHNVQIDFHPFAQKLRVRQYFTPVIGNEVTTPRGHFNIFPVNPGARTPNHKQTDWSLLFDDLQKTPEVKIAILNHARDLHSGVRPFGPALHNAVVGENLDGWPFRFQGMEVVNSGATQTDPLRLFHDWMGLLNHGYQVTPIGSSDSHDVARHFVGQGRTYIRCDDRDPGQLDVDAAVNNFLQGRVMVSYGLLTELTVSENYTSGELATVGAEDIRLDLRILGPHWVKADRIQLYSNGTLIRDELVQVKDSGDRPLGVQWTGQWSISRPRHDVNLVAIATGPGVKGPWWRTAKPYQPTSTDPGTQVIGCSGAVWIDGDGDGKRTSARDSAQRLVTEVKDFDQLCQRLSGYDEATAAQAAHLLRTSGVSLQDEKLRTAIRQATTNVQSGFRMYEESWRENEIARTTR